MSDTEVCVKLDDGEGGTRKGEKWTKCCQICFLILPALWTS